MKQFACIVLTLAAMTAPVLSAAETPPCPEVEGDTAQDPQALCSDAKRSGFTDTTGSDAVKSPSGGGKGSLFDFGSDDGVISPDTKK